MKNRIELLQRHIDMITEGGSRFVERHMHSVANFSAMLAQKRGLNDELATMIGMLHDIHTLLTSDPENHAEHGSLKAREILDELGILSACETDTICTAVKNHSSKVLVQDAYSELIKDADVLSHYFFNVTALVAEHEKTRIAALKEELGLSL